MLTSTQELLDSLRGSARRRHQGGRRSSGVAACEAGGEARVGGRGSSGATAARRTRPRKLSRWHALSGELPRLAIILFFFLGFVACCKYMFGMFQML